MSEIAPEAVASAQGIDVSRYQAPLNVSLLHGLSFAFAKATEGLDISDRNFADNWAAIRAAGLHRGAYHELTTVDPVGQALRFATAVTARGLEPGDMLACVASDYSVSGAQARAFCDRVRSVVGPKCPVILYSDLSRLGVLAECTGYPLWIAHPGGVPASVSPWRAWTFWQWSFGPGPDGGDQDAFNGERAALDAWIATYTGTPKPPPPPADWTYGPPLHLTATGGHTSVRLEWQPPAGAPTPPDHYLIYVYEGPATAGKPPVATYPRTAHGQTWEGGGLTRGTSYTAHVVASGPGSTRVRPGTFASAQFRTA